MSRSAPGPSGRADGLAPWREAQQSVFGAVRCGGLLEAGKSFPTADPGEPLTDAVHRMWWRQVGALPVIQDGVLVGSLGEQSLLRVTADRIEAYEPGRPSAGRESAGPAASSLQVWDELLRGVTVGEAMTPRAEMPEAPPSASLLEGVQSCYERAGGRARYLFVTEGSAGRCVGMITLRDIVRTLIALYDGRLGSDGFESDAARATAESAVRAVLDLSVGEIRRTVGLGHEPVVVSENASGASAIRAMWQGGKGYVVAVFEDGSPQGIFTRRDLLRTLSRPYVDLERSRLSQWMSPSVKTVRELDTLCGVLKSMGMEGCRHMPVVDSWDRLEIVISMWDAVWLLASGGDVARRDARVPAPSAVVSGSPRA